MCVHHILCVGCAVLFVVHKCDVCGVCSSYIVCGVLSYAMLFLCVIYVKVAARVVIIYVCTVARVSPLIYNYYNVLYGAILRFCVQNRCYLYQFIDINSIV